MSKINIRKRNNYYEYRFEIASSNGKRRWLSKSGFKTKPEAQEAGPAGCYEVPRTAA